MKVFVYEGLLLDEANLESLNKWLVEKERQPVENPIMQEVPDDATFDDFVNGYFSQTAYDERKEKVFQAYYKRKVRELIRKEYDEDDEFAILRQRDSKPTEFVLYNTYVENCKKQVKEMLGIVQ